MALRDTRHLRFNDSLLGTMESSLSGGPVHFDYFPNLTVALDDRLVPSSRVHQVFGPLFVRLFNP